MDWDGDLEALCRLVRVQLQLHRFQNNNSFTLERHDEMN